MKISIAGASGKIGSQILCDLTNLNNVESIRASYRKNPKIPSQSKKIIPVIGDLLDVNKLRDLLGDSDVLIFCVGTGASPSINSQEDVWNEFKIVEKISRIVGDSKIKKIVYFSSGGAVYKHQRMLPSNEQTGTISRSKYSEVKLSCEALLKTLTLESKIQNIILRLGNAYGSMRVEDSAIGFVDVAVRELLQQNRIKIRGDLNTAKDFIHLKDISSALQKIITSNIEHSFAVFNVGTGKATTLGEILDIIKKTAFVPTPPATFIEHHPDDCLWYALNCNRLRSLGWNASANIEAEIAKMIQHNQTNYGEFVKSSSQILGRQKEGFR